MDDGVRQGIVLRVPLPHQYTISLFDNLLGRVSAIHTKNPALVHGELISYRLEPWKQTYRLIDVQAMKLPATWVREDILFLHHVLEMALFFIPEHSYSGSLFEICRWLYEDYDKQQGLALMKRLFLGKFFATLGIYPDRAFQEDEQLFHLFARPDKALLQAYKQEDNLAFQKKLQQWLLGCIHTHPHANTFTTKHFLYAQEN